MKSREGPGRDDISPRRRHVVPLSGCLAFTCGTEGPSGIPVFGRYQPKWWLKVEGVRDEDETSSLRHAYLPSVLIAFFDSVRRPRSSAISR
jgi:hypothetical protein